MKNLIFSLLWIPLLLHAIFANAQDWKLKEDKEGIKIYTRPVSNSKIKTLKVLCTLNASLSEITAVLLDIKKQDEWFYHTKSRLLLQVSPSELYYYSEIEFPIPFNNRDFVAHIKLTQNSMTKVVTMNVDNLPDYIPAKNGIVRISQSSCQWVLSPSGYQKVSIEFLLHADPGGSIPYWLVNMFSTLAPFESFKNLKTQLRKPEYVNIHLSYIKD